MQLFERHLEDNIFQLHYDLKTKTYKHSSYQSFYVQDPKQRHIHKAQVRDRVLHHVLYTYLYNVFDKSFIYDSYSCRDGKGTHRAVVRLADIVRKTSKNYKASCWGFKCDIKKFFASVDHTILHDILTKKIKDKDIMWLLEEVIYSFHSLQGKGKGIPLGNLTSQIFANIYLNELDVFIKHTLEVKYYLRYADDFLMVDSTKKRLMDYVHPIETFLKTHLALELHPRKIIFRNLLWGIDYVGYIVLPYHILPRTKTKKRIFKKLYEKVSLYKQKKISFEELQQSLQSYFGYLSHASTHKLTQRLKNQIWFWLTD